MTPVSSMSNITPLGLADWPHTRGTKLPGPRPFPPLPTLAAHRHPTICRQKSLPHPISLRHPQHLHRNLSISGRHCLSSPMQGPQKVTLGARRLGTTSSGRRSSPPNTSQVAATPASWSSFSKRPCQLDLSRGAAPKQRSIRLVASSPCCGRTANLSRRRSAHPAFPTVPESGFLLTSPKSRSAAVHHSSSRLQSSLLALVNAVSGCPQVCQALSSRGHSCCRLPCLKTPVSQPCLTARQCWMLPHSTSTHPATRAAS